MAEAFSLTGVKAVPVGRGQGASIPAREAGKAAGQSASGTDRVELSAEAQKKVAELKRTDQEVRAHEAAHMAAGGGLVQGGASFSYTRGPDGKAYAVAGEVSLDASAVADDPAATLQKAQRIKAAALAPANPSPQDRKVAAQAGVMASQAAAELARKGMGAAQSTGMGVDIVA